MHIPVLLKEVIEYLDLRNGDIIVDATFGDGGHSREILKKILPRGKIIAIDFDQKAIDRGKILFKEFEKNIIFVRANFKEIENILAKLKIKKVNGILADLGFSSSQIENPEYGFAFLKESKLDARLSSDFKISAKEVINQFSQRELEVIFRKYGEERFSRRIAEEIIKARSKKEIETTTELGEIVKKAIPRKFWPKKIHPATRVFQALRIYVNQELENLEEFLQKAPLLLKENGKLIIISYHSGEDRLVKNYFKKFAQTGNFEILTKKPIRPNQEEINHNPRSRSAKMRVLKNKK